MTQTITTTIGRLVEAEPALARLTAVKLDAKTRYHAVKLARLVKAEVRDHFAEPRLELFKELGVARDPTAREISKFGPDKMYDIPKDKTAEFLARIKDLTDVEVTIPWGPITLEMLEPYTDFTGADMIALGPLCALE